MVSDDISTIERYTLALYRERFQQLMSIGSGILICLKNNYYVISAYHVFDMEDEQLQIENDQEEAGIPQDDTERIFAIGINEGESFPFCINDTAEGLVFTVSYDKETEQPVFDGDTEYYSCLLSEEMVQFLINAGKSFYMLDDISFPKIMQDEEIILSGFPQYAKGKYRSYQSEMLEDNKLWMKGLFRVRFDNQCAYNYELGREVQIPLPDGIAGMSGGGLWYNNGNKFIPVGIIIKQDPNEKYVEAFRLDSIVRDIGGRQSKP